MGYHRAGFDVVGVDTEPQPNYPFQFVQADALEYADHWNTIRTFDTIHASPPCQGYHALGREDNPRLIAETRELLDATKLPYVIENIPGARDELRNPILLCGSMFTPVFADRHRLFETNWEVEPPPWPCRHKLAEPAYPIYEHGKTSLRRWPAIYGTGGGKAGEHWGDALGIDWMTRDELAEAIPPAYTEYIGAQLLAHVQVAA